MKFCIHTFRITGHSNEYQIVPLQNLRMYHMTISTGLFHMYSEEARLSAVVSAAVCYDNVVCINLQAVRLRK